MEQTRQAACCGETRSALTAYAFASREELCSMPEWLDEYRVWDRHARQPAVMSF